MPDEVVIPQPRQLGKLAAALAKAQGQMKNPEKNRRGQARGGKYMYADLASVLDAVRGPLSENGIAIIQSVNATPDGAGSCLVTSLIHSSGESAESVYPLPKGAGAQEMGSAITYARRYSLCAMTGVVGEDDDDGAQAEQAGTGRNPEQAMRDELIERMGRASLGNGAVMAYCREAGLGDGKTVDELSADAVEGLLKTWDDAVKAIKAAKKTPANVVAQAKPAEDKADDLDGIAPELANLMRADGITPAMLKAAYVPRFFPATMEPKDLPDDFVSKLITPTNWAKWSKAMKVGAK